MEYFIGLFIGLIAGGLIGFGLGFGTASRQRAREEAFADPDAFMPQPRSAATANDDIEILHSKVDRVASK